MKVQPLRTYNTQRTVFKNKSTATLTPAQPYSIYTGPETSKTQLIKDMEKDVTLREAVETYLKSLNLSIKELFTAEVSEEAKKLESGIDSFSSRIWMY